MIRLNLLEVLVFYEIPQVFVAVDVFGSKYLCLLYPCDDDSCYKYLSVKISERRLDMFKGRRVDLLSMYRSPEENVFYDVTVKEANDISADLITEDAVEPFMLPDEGFYCNYDAIDNDELISHSLQNRRIMSCIAFSDGDNSHNIDLNVLTQALDRYQAMIKNCHIKRCGKMFAYEAKMKVCALRAASFDVHFMFDEMLDLFGESSHISSTLQKIDEVFSSHTIDELTTRVEELKGHTLNSMRSFLQVLEDNHLCFRHKWVKSTMENSVSESIISSETISRVYEFLNSHVELENETVHFDGYFAAGSVFKDGKWKFVTDNKTIIGKTEDSNMFNGIILGDDYRYRIECIEYQETNQRSSSVKTTYKLVRCAPLDRK